MSKFGYDANCNIDTGTGTQGKCVSTRPEWVDPGGGQRQVRGLLQSRWPGGTYLAGPDPMVGEQKARLP